MPSSALEQICAVCCAIHYRCVCFDKNRLNIFLLSSSCDIIAQTVKKGALRVKVSYKKLWKLLIDRDMTQADLRKVSGLSSGSMTKMRQSEPVSMEVLWKVCTAIGCKALEKTGAPQGDGRCLPNLPRVKPLALNQRRL